MVGKHVTSLCSEAADCEHSDRVPLRCSPVCKGLRVGVRNHLHNEVRRLFKVTNLCREAHANPSACVGPVDVIRQPSAVAGVSRSAWATRCVIFGGLAVRAKGRLAKALLLVFESKFVCKTKNHGQPCSTMSRILWPSGWGEIGCFGVGIMERGRRKTAIIAHLITALKSMSSCLS